MDNLDDTYDEDFHSVTTESEEKHLPKLVRDQGQYSATISNKDLHLTLQIFLYGEAFESNTTSDLLNYMI